MPSAKEVEEKGYSQADINKKTIQTIEELVLHILSHEDDIQNLQNKIKHIEMLITKLKK